MGTQVVEYHTMKQACCAMVVACALLFTLAPALTSATVIAKRPVISKGDLLFLNENMLLVSIRPGTVDLLCNPVDEPGMSHVFDLCFSAEPIRIRACKNTLQLAVTP